MKEQIQKEPLPDTGAPLETRAIFFDEHPDRIADIPDGEVFGYFNNVFSWLPNGRYRELLKLKSQADLRVKTFKELGEVREWNSEKRNEMKYEDFFNAIDEAIRAAGSGMEEIGGLMEEWNEASRRSAREKSEEDKKREEEVRSELGKRTKLVITELLSQGFRAYDISM